MKHIVFTIDHKFVRFCAVTMVSILKNDTPSDITVHVVANGLSQADRTVLSDLAITYGASIAFYEVPQEKLEGYAIRWEGQRLPMVVFYRCLLASLLPDSVKKALYLDSDILVLKPLDDFWNTNLEGKALAGVPDDFTVNPVHCNRLGYDLSYNYFNGGVLLLNLDYWRKHNIEQQCKTYYKDNPERVLYNDQDLLNGLLHEHRVLVDMKWNVQEGAYRVPKGKTADWCPPYIDTILHPAILHYSSRKPWQYHCMHPLRHLYFEYQDLTPWKGENVLNNWKPRLHRFIHFLPYTLGLKRSKYLNIIDK